MSIYHFFGKAAICGGLASLILGAGCGVQPVTGGTLGALAAGGELLSEVQLTVYQEAGSTFRPLGFAVTTTDGSFALVTNDAQGPLKLPSGEYRVTLESAGAPLAIPPEYAQPNTTPLKVSWQAGSAPLLLEIPAKLKPVR